VKSRNNSHVTVASIFHIGSEEHVITIHLHMICRQQNFPLFLSFPFCILFKSKNSAQRQ
jgi:hypothetical protein